MHRHRLDNTGVGLPSRGSGVQAAKSGVRPAKPPAAMYRCWYPAMTRGTLGT